MTHSRTIFPLAAVVLGLGLAAADAATVGYWRFEDSPGFLQDSSTNDNDLTAVNTNGGDTGPTAVASPFGTVPLTGAANSQAATFDGKEGNSGKFSDQFTLSEADAGQFPTTALTIEMFVNRSGSVDDFHTFASQFISGGNRAWRIFQNSPGGWNMQLDASGNNSNAGIVGSGFSLVPGKNYYIAAVLEFGDFDAEADADDAMVTFYTQNITDGGSLQSSSGTVDDLGSLYNSSASFTIGGQDENNGANKPFEGVIDEVRFSDMALSQSELLAVPEPASLGLLVMGGLAMIRRRR